MMQEAIPSSYKDPSGFVFLHKGQYYRTIQASYAANYKLLMESGLYDSLQKKKLLLPHTEENSLPKENETKYILHPRQLNVISYGYEWSFSMLKDAALCTLDNAIEAFKFGMILKDANTFNIQFIDGRPVLIDTLSFEQYEDGESWIAYRQFCECFIAPLVLMKYCHPAFNKLLLAYPNGIPMDVCAATLPWKSRFNLHVYLHVYLQGNYQQKKSTKKTSAIHFSKQKFSTLLQGLKTFVQSIHLKNDATTWNNYYNETILSQDYLKVKKELVSAMLGKISFNTLLDLGANDGAFSMLYKQTDKQIISMDEDRNCIDKLYNDCKHQQITNIHPLLIDLSTPSPDIGWNHEERPAIFKRVHPDVTLALALIHHLAIANNLPLHKIIAFLHGISEYLMIEFVPKEDPKVQELLSSRKDIFDSYDLTSFKQLLKGKYNILDEVGVEKTARTLFLLKRID